MTDESFNRFIQKLEAYSKQSPTAYKVKLGLWAVVGYAYIFLVLGGVVGVFGFGIYYTSRLGIGFLQWKVLFVLLGFSYLVINAMRVDIPPPVGIPLNRKQVPDLFSTVNQIRRALRTPRIHQVVLNYDLNAAVAQVPQLGILGFPRNYLVLGMPLMQGMNPEQFKAVLAHEMGHMSGNHGWFAGWIYRVRQTWVQLVVALTESGHWGSVLFIWFFKWYVPFFSAYSFVQVRAQEYEADQSAAALVGPKNIREALCRLEILNVEFHQKFLSRVFSQATSQPKPPAKFLSAYGQAVQGGMDHHSAKDVLTKALAQQTGSTDTHPSLQDRLVALGARREVLAPSSLLQEHPGISRIPGVSSDKAFLGSAASGLIEDLDRQWGEAVASDWLLRFKQCHTARKRWEELEAKATQKPLGVQDLWERAILAGELDGWEKAEPFLDEVLLKESGHVYANFKKGERLLGRGDTEGIPFMVKAIEGALECRLPGYQVLADFYAARENNQEAESYRRKALELETLIIQAREEWQDVQVTDTFEPHDLSFERVNEICKVFVRHPLISEAFLVRKPVRLIPGESWCVLIVFLLGDWDTRPEGDSGDIYKDLVNSIDPSIAIILEERNLAHSFWREAFKKIKDVRIYTRV